MYSNVFYLSSVIVTYAILGASGLWLGTQTEAAGTPTPTERFDVLAIISTSFRGKKPIGDDDWSHNLHQTVS